VLLPEHGEKIMPDWSESLGNVGGGDASGGGGGDAVDAFGDGVRDIRLSKNKRKWHKRLVYAATAKSPGVFLQTSQKINEG
jgi:hypothetical protein